jgi:hypothetical protein
MTMTSWRRRTPLFPPLSALLMSVMNKRVDDDEWQLSMSLSNSRHSWVRFDEDVVDVDDGEYR